MTAMAPMSSSPAYDLVDLAWDLACVEEVGVMIGEVHTNRGVEPCVVAHVVTEGRPFMLVPRQGGAIELWWSEYDVPPSLVATATTIHDIVEQAHAAYAAAARVRHATGQ